MIKNMMLVVGVVVLLVAGVSFLSMQAGKSQGLGMMDKEVPVTKGETPEQESMKKVGDGMMQPTSSRYVEYSKVALDSATANRRVLFFYASWCPTCKPADANLKANADKIPEDLTVIRVNYNDPDTDAEEKDLAKKYGITYQHTFVQIDSNGSEVAKWNGGNIDELLANIK